MTFQKVPAFRASIRKADHGMRVNVGLPVERRDLADERQQLGLLIDLHLLESPLYRDWSNRASAELNAPTAVKYPDVM